MCNKNSLVNEYNFTCYFTGGELATSDETSESHWIPRDNVLDYITVPVLIERFKAYLNFDGNVQYLEYVLRPKFDL